MTVGQCQAKQPFAGRRGVWLLCGAKTVIRYRHACVHEHVVDGFVCGLHIPVPGAVGCQQCWDAGHECPMLAERLPEDDDEWLPVQGQPGA